MKHKTWFRLMLKIVGILFIGLSIPELIASIAVAVQLASTWSSMTGAPGIQPGVMNQIWYTYGFQFVGTVFQFVLGLYLLIGGKWLADKCIPSNHVYCPECGYNLVDSSPERCPECGVNLAHLNMTRINPASLQQREASDNPGDQRHADQPKHDGDKPLQ